MHFLDVGAIIGGRCDNVIRREATDAVLTAKRNRRRAFVLRCLESTNDVLRLSTRGNSDHDVAHHRQSFHLPLE